MQRTVFLISQEPGSCRFVRYWISLQRKVYSYFCALRTPGNTTVLTVRIAACCGLLFYNFSPFWLRKLTKPNFYFSGPQRLAIRTAFLTGYAWLAGRIAPCSEALFLQHFTTQTWSTSWVFISQHPVIAKPSEANAFLVCRKVAFTSHHVNLLFIRVVKNNFAQTWSSCWISSALPNLQVIEIQNFILR